MQTSFLANMKYSGSIFFLSFHHFKMACAMQLPALMLYVSICLGECMDAFNLESQGEFEMPKQYFSDC